MNDRRRRFLSESVHRRTARQRRCGRGEHVAAVEGRRCAARDGQLDRPDTRDEERGREDTIVGSDEKAFVARHGERRTRGANAGIDDDDMNRSHRKASPDARHREPRPFHILRRNVMRDIDDLHVRSVCGDHAFHLADISVDGTEVGRERYDRSHRSNPTSSSLLCATAGRWTTNSACRAPRSNVRYTS